MSAMQCLPRETLEKFQGIKIRMFRTKKIVSSTTAKYAGTLLFIITINLFYIGNHINIFYKRFILQ